MNLHRFLAYTVLACWIAATAIMAGTSLQWFSARNDSFVKTQRAREAQSEASGNSQAAARQFEAGTPEDRETTQATQRNQERLVRKAESASEEMADAINLEQLQQHQFWMEFAVWGCLTLLGSALLAERRETDERAHTSK